MKLNELHPLNKKIVCHMRSDVPAIASPDSHPDPYMKLGSHPEAVQRVWDDLGGALPVDCRAIIFGTPALVDPNSGVVLAMSYGTAYSLRVPKRLLDAAYKAGCKAEQKWTNGGKTNIEDELGHGWVFGAWADDELQWVLDIYFELQETT